MNKYQKSIYELGEKVFNCPHFEKECKPEIKLTSSNYKHGPELSFVGSKYGQGIRILFTRLNPIWPKDKGYFGSKESISMYIQDNPKCSIEDIYNHILKGWKYKERVFWGMQDAGTVTGYSNQRLSRSEKYRKNPKYGIQLIMDEMIKAKIFPKTENTLDYCAINNVIKCAGSLKNSNPGENMKNHMFPRFTL